MKDENIKQFFTEHKQEIPDESFSNRIFAALDCLPEPKPRVDRSRMITAIFAAVGFILFAMLGGYSVLLEGLSSVGGIFVNYKSATPEIVITIFFTFCALFSIARFAIKDTQ
ncbi:MAG: hypothetical protein ACD_77C00330G0005 [uncultured bacterium]|nr:MAG: hypothetical protein ACD_77C00330G0005 [uncultured bacterium]HBY02752.1 hypothetical protein [Rikenellaceae bacterium]